MTFSVRSIALALGSALGLALPAIAVAAQEPWPERPLSTVEQIAEPRTGPLSEAEVEMAQTAWRYFENNWQPETGLVNAAHDYPSVTLWDTGSYMAALISASELGLIDAAETEQRLDRLLDTLSDLWLFHGQCPNKAYDTRTVIPTDYNNKPGEIGCSAYDIARLLVWLRVVEQRYPAYAEQIHDIVGRWCFCNLVVAPGVLQGLQVNEDGSTYTTQEGRLGYEEYAAAAFALWGFDVQVAFDPEPYSTIWMNGVEIPFDQRDARAYGAHNSVVTESYALYGMEFGFADPSGTDVPGWITRAAQNIYEIQERRFEETGILTARTEHQLVDNPYFVYDTIFANGRPWGTITEAGQTVPQYAAVASKGAVSLWALWDTSYTDQLFAHIAPQFDPELGYYEGVYEDGSGPIAQFTANNNGIILEALNFKANGPVLQPVEEPRAWVEAVEAQEGKCLPGHEPEATFPAEATDGSTSYITPDCATR